MTRADRNGIDRGSGGAGLRPTRPRLARRRLVAAAAAVVPALGLFGALAPAAWASGLPQVSLVASGAKSCLPVVGTPCPAGNIGVPVAESAVNPANGDVALLPTGSPPTRVYLVAGATETEFGLSMTAGSAYLIAGNGANNAAPTPGSLATSTAVVAISLAFDNSGDLVVGDNAGVPSLDLVARSSGEAYGQAVTAGDIYKLAAPGAQSAPVVSLPETVGEATGQLDSLAVDGAGDIFVGEKSYGVVALDEQASALGEFGQSIPAGGAAFVVGQVTTTFDYPDLATPSQPATASAVQGATVAVDGWGDLVFLATADTTDNDNVDTVWVLPTASSASFGRYGLGAVAAGDMYLVAGTPDGPRPSPPPACPPCRPASSPPTRSPSTPPATSWWATTARATPCRWSPSRRQPPTGSRPGPQATSTPSRAARAPPRPPPRATPAPSRCPPSTRSATPARASCTWPPTTSPPATPPPRCTS